METVRVLPAPTVKTWLAVLGLGALTLLAFQLAAWQAFAVTGLLTLGALCGLADAIQAAPFYREYGLTSSEGRLGEPLPVHFHLRGGPRGCRVGTLRWNLECSLVTRVEADYIEGVVYRPTYATIHSSEGLLTAGGHLFPGEEQSWLLPIPLPADGMASCCSGREDVEGAITWQLTVLMEVPGQPPVGVTKVLSCWAPSPRRSL